MCVQTEAAALLAPTALNKTQGGGGRKMSNYVDKRSICPINLDCLWKVTQSLRTLTVLGGGEELDTVKLPYHVHILPIQKLILKTHIRNVLWHCFWKLSCNTILLQRETVSVANPLWPPAIRI